MAAEYISREAASDLLAMALIDEWEPEYAQDRLSEIPAEDVRPVVRGKWNAVEKPLEKATICECSECKHRIWMYDGDDGWNYCPTCGADMREVQTDG